MTKEDQGQPHSQTFVVYVEDKPGVLNRIASLFRRRAFNIESLNVGHTDQPGISRMTIVIEGDDITATRFEAYLYKLVNVLKVENVSDAQTVQRDLALIKVRSDQESRSQILELCKVFRARVIDVAVDTLIVEITGTEEKIEGLIGVLSPFGIVEMVRTGVVAMTRGSEAPSYDPHFVPAQVPKNRRSAILA